MTISKPKKILASVGLGAGLLAGTLGASWVMPGSIAAAAPATASAPTHSAKDVLANHPALRHLARVEFKVAAGTIGVPPKDLLADVKAGQSIADVATANNVPVDNVVNAVVGDLTAKIDQAVSNGRVTQKFADRVEPKLTDWVTRAVNIHHGGSN